MLVSLTDWGIETVSKPVAEFASIEKRAAQNSSLQKGLINLSFSCWVLLGTTFSTCL